MRRVMGNHLEGLWDERPPHGRLYVLVDLLDPSAGFVLGYQLDAWQIPPEGHSVGRCVQVCSPMSSTT